VGCRLLERESGSWFRASRPTGTGSVLNWADRRADLYEVKYSNNSQDSKTASKGVPEKRSGKG